MMMFPSVNHNPALAARFWFSFNVLVSSVFLFFDEEGVSWVEGGVGSILTRCDDEDIV